ncbi:hypothetical protein GLOIN_2v1786507 [Rhizophagus clarus]|uniref:RRM domain-containing protein n=1 Tax=Rhizophagus clarus TaxID=94130 RepID=A0A8H3LLN3_9GLOM|nr:hypothetical protein GLOIN_2v1786507 [Rhizophagus clarus]
MVQLIKYKKSTHLANKTAKNQPQVVVPVEKSIVSISASSIASNTSFQLTDQDASAGGPSITVKKEIMASKAKTTLAEKQAIAKEIALTSNLKSKRSLAVINSVKKQTTFTCYTSDLNEDAMVTDPPNQEDQQTCSNGLFKKSQIQNIDQQLSDLKMDVDPKLASQQVNNKPVDQPEVITLSDDNDSFILIPKLFTVYTESNNLSHAIFSNEDSYNKVLQGRFHTKINEEDQDSNIMEKNTAFQFKFVMKEKLQKNKEEIDNKKERTIQVFDIPLYTEKKTIQNSFSLLGEIVKINTRAHGQYQQAYIIYKDVNSVQRFYHKWSHFIGKEYIRVTPILLSEEQRDQRKQHSLRLSGLPIRMTAINLRPILDEMNTMTCFISRNPFHYKPFTYAYVNFKNEEDKEIAMKKKFSIKQGKIDKLLFISDPTIKRNIYNNCGNPDHLYAGCNIKKYPNKRNNTVKAARKKKTKLTAQNKNRSYAQVVKSNATPNQPLQQKQCLKSE